MIADTHAHLDMLDDPVGALRRAAEEGVSLICTVVNVTDHPERTFEGLDAWRQQAASLLSPAYSIPDVRILVGTHPHDASKTDATAIDLIRRYADDPRVVGMGELGLDYHYDNSPRDVQRAVFADQIRLAHELDLPICIHLREAHEDGLRILTEEGVPSKGAILHCFGLEYEVAAPFVEMGCYVSFAGPITFKKAVEVREAASQVPGDRLLSETDSPFLAPEPMRGRTNEPAHVRHIVEELARDQGMSFDEMAGLTLTNAHRFFHL